MNREVQFNEDNRFTMALTVSPNIKYLPGPDLHRLHVDAPLPGRPLRAEADAAAGAERPRQVLLLDRQDLGVQPGGHVPQAQPRGDPRPLHLRPRRSGHDRLGRGRRVVCAGVRAGGELVRGSGEEDERCDRFKNGENEEVSSEVAKKCERWYSRELKLNIVALSFRGMYGCGGLINIVCRSSVVVHLLCLCVIYMRAKF